jgi:hypothetical protein
MAGLAALAAAQPAPDAETSARALRLGLLASTDAAGMIADAGRDREAATTVRLTARWGDVESVRGRYDWSRVEQAVDTLVGAGHRVTLCLTGSNSHYLPAGELPSPVAGDSIGAWVLWARSAVRRFAGRVEMFQVWDGPDGAPGAEGAAFDPGVYAFLLKQAALAIRAEAEAVGEAVQVAQGAVGVGSLEWQRQVWAADSSAYIDVLPVRLRPRDTLTLFYAEAIAHPPAPQVWAYVEPDPRDGAYTGLGTAVRALTEGASLASSPLATELVVHWTLGVQEILDGGYAPAPVGGLELLDEAGRRAEGEGVVGRFVSAEDFSTVVIYESPPGAGAGDELKLITDTSRVRDARSVDPAAGSSRRTASSDVAGETGRRAIRAPAAPWPMIVRFGRGVAPGLELPPEEVEVERTRSLTAEEIIARYQQVQQRQDDRLERWTAKGRIDFHFKLAQGGSTVDISIDSNYFWERGGQMEWEQTDYYVNGNRVRWKNIPELPLIQPEKVITLPLDLTLDKTYGYRLVGEDRVRGRDAYVLAFRPGADAEGVALYQGRVWIDRESFQRLKVSLVQTRTGTPAVLSNEERDLFLPQPGPDGEYWMLSEIDGQQIWSAAGRNFVVQREVRFSEFDINPPVAEFEARRREAYASDNQMLRDTEGGFRYLQRESDGSRTLKEGVDTSQWFAAAGLFQDSSTDNVTPLAGANYFNYDLWGKNIQFSALLAGAVNFVTASKPDLIGERVSGTLDAAVVGIKFNDKFFVGDEESRLERVEQRPQSVGLRLGVPFGAFVKLNLIADLTYRDYFLEDGSEDKIERLNTNSGTLFEYVLPEDHLETEARVELEYSRRGWNVVVEGSRAHRSDWEAFGLFDVTSGTFLEFDGTDPNDPASYGAAAPQEVNDDFTRFKASLFKEWFLPKFQKLRGEVNVLDGSDLDRFSRYEFSFFGDDRLNGFSGSGVRFDNGVIGRLGYAFNLFEVIRLDAVVEAARVEDESLDLGEQEFTGFGLSGNFVGPWKTVINVNWGIGLDSDIDGLDGESEFLVLVFKLFK